MRKLDESTSPSALGRKHSPQVFHVGFGLGGARQKKGRVSLASRLRSSKVQEAVWWGRGTAGMKDGGTNAQTKQQAFQIALIPY